jgi:hypothetical protein
MCQKPINIYLKVCTNVYVNLFFKTYVKHSKKIQAKPAIAKIHEYIVLKWLFGDPKNIKFFVDLSISSFS